jgi:hypothetical protein
MERPLTRRQFAATAFATSTAAQTPEPQRSQADELAAARDRVRQASAALRKIPVPILLEPSFAFRP